MLEPMSPEEAVVSYIKDRETELTRKSRRNQESRLRQFVRWTDEVGIDDMNEITGRQLHEYKLWRAEDIKPITLKQQLTTVRMFIRFCERIDAVASGVSDSIVLPQVRPEEEICTDKISKEEAKAILEYCEKYEYASFRHTLFYLLWHTGIRRSTVHAFDLNDYGDGYLRAVSRDGTRLKNGIRSQREINIKPGLQRVLDDYIETNHPKVRDDHGRMSLLGTRFGRPEVSTIQGNIYAITRPCEYTNKCPHGRVIEDCEATKHDRASKCPSSMSPHAIRRGSITAHRNANVPKDVTSDRMDVSGDVLDKHYDHASESERRERRKEFLNGI